MKSICALPVKMPNVNSRWYKLVANELNVRPSAQNKPPTNTTERHEKRWHNADDNGAKAKHSADSMAGIHEATAVELDGKISRISTNKTPYDLTWKIKLKVY